MSDDDERQLSSSSSSQYDIDNRRRLSEIKLELQALMRQKKKYDVEKLTQDSEFLHSEISDIRTSIQDINRDINNQTHTKKNLHVQMTNLRSRSRLRYSNLAMALREKRSYEGELKKENKTEEYRELARRQIRLIEAALPILKEEDEYKAQLKIADDAQQAATNKRKKLEESLNKNLRKQTEIKQLLSENAEKLPKLETTIENLRSERERLVSSTGTSSANRKRQRHRLSANQPRTTDSPTDTQIPFRSFASLEEDSLEHEKQQHEEQLKKVDTLINYFREKMTEHGLNINQSCTTPSSELTSPLYHPITPYEEQTILSSYMNEKDSDYISLSKTTTNEPITAIAMKLPRQFVPLNFHSTTTNEIIHSPLCDGNEFEYKKELSSDILNKYGGKAKMTKQQQLSSNGKKQKKNKKNFGITHLSQMIALYNDVRTSSGSSDTLPSMPMYEYDLFHTIKALESLKQSLESYLNELPYRITLSIDDIQSKSGIENEDDDIRDSALDTFSETSSFIEPMSSTKHLTPAIPQLMNILEARSSTSSDDKKTVTSSSSPPSSHHSDSKKEQQPSSNGALTTVEELTTHFSPLSFQTNPIDRQISDEGYRSVRNEQQITGTTTSNHNSPLLTRSKSYDCSEKVDKWLSSTTAQMASSLPMSTTTYNNRNHIDFQATDIDNEEEEENLIEATTILMPND